MFDFGKEETRALAGAALWFSGLTDRRPQSRKALPGRPPPVEPLRGRTGPSDQAGECGASGSGARDLPPMV